MPKLKLTREALLVCGAVLLLGIALVRAYLGSRPPEPLAQFAARVYATLDAGHGEELYQYLSPQQREEMTRSQFASLIAWRDSCLKGFRPAGKRFDATGSNEYMWRTAMTYRDETGYEIDNVMVFQRSSEGPVLNSWDLVANAFKAKYGRRYESESVRQKNGLLIRDGLREESQRLASFGKGISDGGEFVSWADMRVGIETNLYFEQRRAKAPNWPGPTSEEILETRKRFRNSIK
jgi:hypothetical protein